MKRVATYIRVSTDRQAQEGESIPAQRDALAKYIKDHGYIHVREYLDDGISGTKNDRDEFQKMLSGVKAGQIDLILVTKMDRLHRSLRNFLNMQDILDKHNCAWLAIWEPMYDSSTPQGRMIINTMMNLAQFEAEQTGQRIRQVFAYKRSVGEATTGKVPPGYKVENKKIVIDDEKADAARGMFRHFIEFGCLSKTSRFMLSEYGIKRNIVSTRRLLMNKAYIGKGGSYGTDYPRLIDDETFCTAQNMLAKNIKTSATHTYIFTGLIKCAECGMRYSSYSRNGGQHAYRCQKHVRHMGCQNSVTINELKLEEYLLENLEKEFGNFVVEMKAEQLRAMDNRRKIAELNKKIDRLKDLYVNGLIEIEEYKADKESYLLQISELEKEQNINTGDPDKLIDIVTNLTQIYSEIKSPEDKRSFWRSIIREIVVDIDRNVRIIFY